MTGLLDDWTSLFSNTMHAPLSSCLMTGRSIVSNFLVSRFSWCCLTFWSAVRCEFPAFHCLLSWFSMVSFIPAMFPLMIFHGMATSFSQLSLYVSWSWDIQVFFGLKGFFPVIVLSPWVWILGSGPTFSPFDRALWIVAGIGLNLLQLVDGGQMGKLWWRGCHSAGKVPYSFSGVSELSKL